MNMLIVKYGWYRYRKEQGHPISLWRAMFSALPRFGSYESSEAGCPAWALQAYKDFA